MAAGLHEKADRRGTAGLEPVDDQPQHDASDQRRHGIDADGKGRVDRHPAGGCPGSHQRHEVGEEADLGRQHDGEGRGDAPEMPFP